MYNRGEIYVRNYITWDDLKIGNGHKLKLDIKLDRGNQTGFIIVDQNGGGDSRTVQGAVDMVPEKVHIPKNKPFVSLIGDEKRTSDTVITWNDKAIDKDKLVVSRFACPIIFSRRYKRRKQAVALRVSGENAMFYRVRILGTQDTLLDEVGAHYYYQSFIQGSIDFIFGYAKSLYEDCIIHSIAETSGAIAAQHRDSPWSDTGFSFVNCTINGTGKILLGRAWGNYSRITYSYCDIDDIIVPGGWSDWRQPFRQKYRLFPHLRLNIISRNIDCHVWRISVQRERSRSKIQGSMGESAYISGSKEFPKYAIR
ncbi:hypothetical protein Leryth_013763 [Lithospermum erythrorhizon]|nr:hypothetical protein Leryth_013763 [Lithospermum erythrorhizon]